MSRPRLMTTNGCTMCRRRRKKCCETRPVCSSCHRHSLPCFWNKLPNGRTRAEAEFVFSEDSNDADTFNSISRVLQTAQCFPALSTTFSNALDEHIIASSSRDGWTTTSRRLTLDPQWTPLSCLDHELARLKHSPFCRVTALWIARVVSKVSDLSLNEDRTRSYIAIVYSGPQSGSVHQEHRCAAVLFAHVGCGQDEGKSFR